MNIRYGAEIAAAAATRHLDPRLLAAVAAQETGGPGSNSGSNVVGDGGHGHGLFQIDDRFWSFARSASAMDPAKNAQVAAGILGDNLRRFGGNVRSALSAYNAGSPTATGTKTTWADGKVLGYADSVMRHYAALGGATEHVAADARTGMAAADPLGGRAFRPARIASDVPTASAAASGAPPTLDLLRLLLAQGQLTSSAPVASPTSSSAALQPPRSWSQLTAASSTETAAADRSLADLVDTGDVFDGADDTPEA